MKINIKFEKKYAITVQQHTLDELITLLNKYYPDEKVSISAHLKNDAVVRFENSEELFSYDNTRDYRITELCLESSSNYRIIFKADTNFQFFFYMVLQYLLTLNWIGKRIV